MAVLHAHDLTVRYGDKTVLDSVSLQLAPGDIYGLSGPNGSGKSTLIRALCGLVRADSGRIEISGHALQSQRPAALGRVGYVAQRFALYPDLTVEENIRFYARCHGFSSHEVSSLTEQALDQFHLHSVRAQAAGTLSHGWSQRLALAAAACHQPDLLLLDETTAGLDAAAANDFWTALRSLAARGACVLLATHHTEDSQNCTRLGAIHNARLEEVAR